MKNKIVEQRNCFAYHPKQCRVLTEMLCKKKKCPFFKTHQQYVDDLIKYTSDIGLRDYLIDKYRK